jgi:two-component system, cell cycle sensor histidine kinase and response regulator CckA
MSDPPTPPANRILIIDDNQAIHTDFRKILGPRLVPDAALQEAKALVFGMPAAPEPTPAATYQIDSAAQGQDGLHMVEQAAAEGRPYALAFVDVRMPPGWDGIETVARIWQKFPELPVVICTAYSDYSWLEMTSKLGHSDNLVILRKPFEAIEVLQLAQALTRKWLLARQVRAQIEELDRLVQSRTRNFQEANEALRHSEERFARAFRHSPVPQALLNTGQQRCVDVNDSFLRLTGFKREEVLEPAAVGWQLFTQPETEREILAALQAERPVRNLQAELRTREGKNLTVLISAEAFELDEQPHLLISLQDLTERLNIENQLRQAQKMEVVGQIAAGIAHDFNNILSVVQGHAELQLNMNHEDASLVESLHEINRAANRAASFTRQLLAFSRKQMLHRRPLDLREALHNLDKMLQRIIGEHVSLQIQCAEHLPPVYADAISFEQVVINLAVNARDAMPRGGPLAITAEPVEIDAQYKERVPDASLGTFVCLTVADKGAGIDAAVRDKIFEPFFTTKDVGKGTGMGLATVYGIVKQHQGWIEVESQLHVGSRFKVFLPVANGAAQATAESRPELIQATGIQPRTILVVEDEAPLREMASKILQRLGYRVVAARDGLEALNLWPQHRGEIDLLFTDMVMPGGMTGRELADRLLREEPRLQVIYSTGYSMDLAASGLHLVEGVNFLPKPYDATTLGRAVKKSLASGN